MWTKVYTLESVTDFYADDDFEDALGEVCTDDQDLSQRIRITVELETESRIATLEARLAEAEAIIKELDAEIPSSTVMFYGWLGEVRRRAAAFLAGGDTNKV